MTTPTPRQADSLRDRVYLSLRDDLMSGCLGPGDRLGEERLAEQYGVSRTPVREALARLLADGLIQRGDSGLYPYRPRFEELVWLYELRITLETQGIRRVLADDSLTHDPAILGPELERWYLLREHPPEPDAGFVTADEQFHRTLLAAAGNPTLSDALAVANAKVRPVRMYDYLTPDRMAATVDEHITIAEMALARRLTDAHDTLLRHIDTSRAVVLDRVRAAMAAARMAAAVRA